MPHDFARLHAATAGGIGLADDGEARSLKKDSWFAAHAGILRRPPLLLEHGDRYPFAQRPLLEIHQLPDRKVLLRLAGVIDAGIHFAQEAEAEELDRSDEGKN